MRWKKVAATEYDKSSDSLLTTNSAGFLSKIIQQILLMFVIFPYAIFQFAMLHHSPTDTFFRRASLDSFVYIV